MLRQSTIIMIILVVLFMPMAAQDDEPPRIITISAELAEAGDEVLLSTNQPLLVCSFWGTSQNESSTHPLGVTDGDGELSFIVPEVVPGSFTIYCAETNPPGGGVTVTLSEPIQFTVVGASDLEIIATPVSGGLCVAPVTEHSTLVVNLDQTQSINYVEIPGLPEAGNHDDVAIILVDFFESSSVDLEADTIEQFSHGDLVTRHIFGLKRAYGGDEIRLITIDVSESEGDSLTTNELIDRIRNQIELASEDGYQQFVVILDLMMIPCWDSTSNYQDALIAITGQLQTIGQGSAVAVEYVAPAGDGGIQEIIPAALPGITSVTAADYPNMVQASYANPSKDAVVEVGGIYSGLLDGYGLRGTSFAAPVHAVRLALAHTIGGDSLGAESPVTERMTPEEFVAMYYQHVNDRDYATTWTWLSDRFKERRDADFEIDYVGWWNRVAEVEIGRVDNISEGDTEAIVFAELVYHMKDGSVVPHPTPYFYLVRDGDSWLIDNTAMR